MAQLEVELSASLARVSVSLEGRAQPGEVRIALPRPIDDERAKAKFVKKSRELRIVAPMLDA